MKILVLGATGGTGKEIVSQALERGHIVMALVRSPEKIASRHEHLIVIKADVTSESELSENLVGHDAVLSALGPVDLKPNSILRDSARAVTEAMKAAGVKRILAVSVSTLFPTGASRRPVNLYNSLRSAQHDSRRKRNGGYRTSERFGLDDRASSSPYGSG